MKEKTIYSYDQAMEASVKYFDGDDLAARVFIDKYALRDENGNILEDTPEKMHHRIAKEFARIEKDKFKDPLTEDEIFGYIDGFKYIVPQGSPMSGIGNDYQITSLSNCYVLDTPLDSYNDIMKVDSQLVNISKRRGGVGINLSNLRPNGAPTKNAARSSTGIVTWMERYSHSIREVGQCIEENQRVLTDRGLVKIKDVNPNDDKAWTMRGWVSVTDKIKNRKPVFKVTTKCGYELLCSLDHLLAVPSPTIGIIEKKLKELRDGDSVVLLARDVADKFLSISVLDKCDIYNDGIAFKDEIVGIEHVGESTVYDLTLEKEHLFWCEGFYVHNSNRRGALMLTLDVRHPDIEEFIFAKQDNSKVTGANISVMISNDFMRAVENNEEFDLVWPINSKEPKIKKTVNAKELWGKIVKSARDHAEPGILFWDNFLDNGPADQYEKYRSESTNPCQPAWAPFLTPDGIKPMGDIRKGDVIWHKNGWTTVVKKWSTGVKKVYRYGTTACCFYGTKDHRLVSKGRKIKAEDCDSIDIISGEYKSDITLDPQDIIDGIVFGDGSVHKASNNLVHLYIGADDQDYFDSEISHLILKKRDGLKKDIAYEISTTITHEELPKTWERDVPDRFFYGNREKVCGFLRGIFTANGGICGDRVALKTSSFIVVEKVQMMLNSVGIASYYTTNKAKKIKFSNGEYQCKVSYDVNITKDKEKFFQIIGFIQEYKEDKLYDILQKHKPRNWHKESFGINSVDLVSEEEVFDITVDNASHTYWTGGCDVSNCSEISLCPMDSCRLMALNLLSFVEEPFTDNACFDFDKFSNYSRIAQRLMDDLVDLESEKIKKIISKIDSDPEPEEVKRDEKEMWSKILWYNDEGRRTGLGITALGDTMAALGIGYATEESIEITEKIYKTLKLSAYRESVEMAKLFGAFNGFDHGTEKASPFIERIKSEHPDLYSDMKKYGRRNVAILTTAPTGSLSILAQTTSGIEPVFMLNYKRRKKINPHDNESTVDFVDDNGDKWQEFDVYHPSVKKWMEISGCSDLEKSPWFGYDANNIDWHNRVHLQAAAQKHVCHSISSTINLPNDVSEEEVGEIYMEAFRSGCKGMTVYRDGSRSGVMVSKEEKPAVTFKKRPKDVACEVHFPTCNGKKYYVVVGLTDGEPYEVFTNINSDENDEPIIPKSVSKGILHKKSRGKYIVKNEDKEFSRLLTNGHSDDNADVLTRLISCGLRYGVTLDRMVHQLEKAHGDLQSFSKVLARVLKKYIKDGIDVFGEECPECGGSLIRESGCKICKGTKEKAGCGWTACQ